jgi:uncharacterized protein with von Willebrand factor type A (vWA) domain
MTDDSPIGLEYFVGFGRALRAEGVQLGSAETELFIKALAKAAVKNLRDIYWVGRACLTSSPEQIPIYDRIFQEWFQNAGDATFPAALAVHQEESPPIISRPQNVTLEVPNKSGPASGRVAAWDERRGLKRDSPPNADELADMHRITGSLNARPPARRSRRFRAGGRRGPPHLRRILRAASRTGGELFRLIRSRRLTRIRPMVLLIDVSKSMAGHSRAFAQFARAALRRKGKTEVLCFATHLTAVTKLLRPGEAGAALERTSAAVQDWDGGTRLSSALEELFRSPRHSQAIRGAIVILLSDGLERGSGEALVKNIGRLSRLGHQLIWINPLCADPRFTPRAAAIRAILPFVDKVYGCQDLQDLADLSPKLFADS